MNAILAIEQASFPNEPYPAGLFLEYAESAPELFLVAMVGKRIAGYSIAALERFGAELVSIAVAPRARRSGVGAALLESTLRRVRARGAVRMSLMVREADPGAIGFYRRFGFRRIRRVPGYYEDGAPALRMRLDFVAPRDVL